MRRVWPLTVRGTGALVLAIACFVLANELGLVELLYFGILLLATLAASIVSLYVTRRTESVGRSLSPDVATVGRPSTVTVRVGVRTAVPTAAGLWRDAVPAGLTGVAHGVFPALGSGLRGDERAVELRYTITGARRGVHPLGPLSVTSTDPFGLARRSNVLGVRTQVTVTPAIVDLPVLANFSGESGGTLHTTTNQIGQGSDNLIARPYAPGDSMRRIHWRATAHRDALMVRQEEQESTPEATVVLDRAAERWSAEALRTTGLDAGFEAAVSSCISVVSRLVTDGYVVELIDSDGTALADPIDGGDLGGVEAVATHLATITARRGDTLAKLPLLFAGAMTGPVVVVTGRFDPADAEALAPLVHHSALPIVLAAAPTGDALDRATDLGWRAAPIGADADLVAAWSGAADQGVSNVVA
ncbi:DUF58 domain-containing protein [Microbacterium rhizomatis]|uniref:DUF58 domain-containing protein n=1 Tax=Microbacterium rhizomatis TaxID=1631477 RepID=A0A5J5J0T3_9MICO|nr:DUF58 domain-containing protein [Microbacterium rhizomatis]KAA9107594.1 DUF58 domain-containing protein [Microbacterium rhizomatis]